ncbi:helix-turn-helix transcriptional regulator [Bacillaceae bacterium IKA-2]|nr:helix-turn-helix transcriptional regulator [Bacillaceae bacterium IKA-2]
MKRIGEKIRSLRLEHGLTLKELGAAIDFNYSNLSKIERGNRKPAIEVLESLSNYFNIDISYFFYSQKQLSSDERANDIQIINLTEQMKQKNISLEELIEMVGKRDHLKESSDKSSPQ